MIRAPNHLGDVVMALPALSAADADIAVVRWLAPVLDMAGLSRRVLPFDRGWRGWLDIVFRLRRGGYERGMLLTPAFSAAWMLRWGGVGRLRGTATDARGWLLEDGVHPASLRDMHRVDQYRLLLQVDEGVPRTHVTIEPPAAAVSVWWDRLAGDGGPLVGIVPGSNAPSRRWPVHRFAEVARQLDERGVMVVVLGGPGERERTRTVAEAAGGTVDAGGATTLEELAAVLSLCDLVVTNDTGPMHLAGALGVPTVGIWGPSDPAAVQVRRARSAAVSGEPLPCKPCFKNHCPRTGAGTRLPQAHEECMRLITVEQVMAAVSDLLTEEAA